MNEWDYAKEAIKRLRRNLDGFIVSHSLAVNCVTDNEDRIKEVIAHVISEAILAEREACARICKDEAEYYRNEFFRLSRNEQAAARMDSKAVCALVIENKIRARSNAPEAPNKALESPENLQSSTFPASAIKTCT